MTKWSYPRNMKSGSTFENQGQRDGSADEGAYGQAWGTEFTARIPHGRRIGPTPTNCPLTSILTSTVACPPHK